MSVDPRPDATVRAVRQAHDLLDECPSAGVRARILKAAAAHADASRAPSAGAAPAGFRRWLRAPWFASAAAMGAATVLVTAIGLRLEQPKQTAQPAVARVDAAPDAGGLSAPSRRSPLEAGAGGGRAAAAPSSESQRAVASAAASSGPALATRSANVQADEELRPSGVESSVAAHDSVRATATAQGSASARAPAAPSTQAGAAVSAQGSDAMSPFSQPSVHSVRSMEANEAIAPPATVAQGEPLFRKSAPTWLARVRELRKAGRQEQADRELKLFLQAHPEAVLPEDLRRP